MPLILQSIPLSLGTFWRYLILMPFLALAGLIMAFAMFVPILGAFVPGIIGTFWVLVGLRCALSARGHLGTPVFAKLLRYSFLFCLINAFAGFVLSHLANGLLSLGYQVFYWTDHLPSPDQLTPTGGLAIIGSYLGIYILLMTLWSAAMAVPMTAAAASAGNWRSPDPNPFEGFAQGMASLALISLIWIGGGQFFAFFGEIVSLYLLAIDLLLAWQNGTDPTTYYSLQPGNLIGGTLLMAWASSWFFATAVLFWERRQQRIQTARQTRIEATRVSSADLRALREARDRGQRGPIGGAG